VCSSDLFTPSSLLESAKNATGALRTLYAWYSIMTTGRDLRASGRMEFVRGTIYEYLVREGYEGEFVEKVFLPAMASLCTCTMEDVRGYPARNILGGFEGADHERKI
jgi:predicted NAD/FAD-binding protein